MKKTTRWKLQSLRALAICVAVVSAVPVSAQVVRKPSTTRPSAVSKAPRTKQNTKVAAPKAAPQRRTADTVIPRFKIDEKGGLVPDVRAAAAIIYNPETHQVLWEENSQDLRSIASITKVMTAVVVLEGKPDLSQPVVITRQDTWQASTTHLRAGDKVTVGGLMDLLLIASDNAAARALARTSPLGPLGFIERMNEKARELELQNTFYADPSGLFSANVSSAYDMARLIAYAAGDDRISAIMRKPAQQVWTGRRYVTVRSTNQLLQRSDLGDVDVKGGKTGFIAKSGYCFATLLGIPQFKQQVAVVVLGARSNAARFMETRNILSWLLVKAQDLFPKDGSQ